MTIFRSPGFANDPVSARENPRSGGAQPGVVACEAVVLGEHPENPTMVLVIAAGFITAGAVKNALFGREIAGQCDRALIMQPGIQTLLCLLVIAASIQVDHHHAGLVAISAVGE